MNGQHGRAHLIADTLQTLRRFADAEFATDGTRNAAGSEMAVIPAAESQEMMDLRNYISARVAAFRTRRQLLQVEREAHLELEIYRLRIAASS